MTCHIIVEGGHEFKQIHDVVIDSGMDMLTDTARFRLPASIQGKGRNLEQVFAPGKKIRIEVGYETYPKTIFSGFIAQTKPEHPFVIECEDMMWLLKQVNLTQSWAPGTATLKSVVDYIIEEVNAQWPLEPIELEQSLPDVAFDEFTIDNANAAQALQQMKDNFGLTVYIVPNTNQLYVGLAFTADRGRVNYDFGLNVISTQLSYKREDEVKLTVEATGITKSNERITVTVGPEDGEKRTIYRYNVSSEAQLKQIAEQARQELVYDGYEGSLTAFLIPFCQHGMSAKLIDPDYPERDGTYHVDKLRTSWGTNGGRNEVFLGIKLSEI